ncbi:MAG: helix-turn-helix domain-containing protein [Acidimicrobiales bacterium]
MRITPEITDATVLGELGDRLARTRLEHNITQQGLATEAGVSKSTVERLEAGGETKLSSFIRVLRVLGLLDQLDRLVPEPLPSPIEALKRQGKARRRATPAPKADGTQSATWTWGDDDTP